MPISPLPADRRACLALFLILGSCTGSVEESQLAPVLGTWRTEEPRYADRYFELRADRRLVIGVGRGAVTIGGLVELVATRTHPRQIDYVIEYEDPSGTESVLRFELDPETEQIRMANQPGVVWNRVEGVEP